MQLGTERQDRCAAAVNWPPFRPDTRHNLEGLRRSSSTGYVDDDELIQLMQMGAVRRRHLGTTEQKLHTIL